LALDEPKDGDQGITINNLDFVVDKEFYESAQPFEIDYSDFGFSIKCNLPVPDTSGCGGCKCGE
jgi:iron-sulfur cluster assembly protein